MIYTRTIMPIVRWMVEAMLAWLSLGIAYAGSAGRASNPHADILYVIDSMDC